ncbi:glycosyl transferase [Jannaschia pagri]|uniref:Glycosyl transferase n=2 Tax=Jannaschia TaxID=188905 RepID=A0ABQ4NN57_9RHOB|nr:glycosyl transferase [Jannaschia sp. AI_61]GIT95848.1 glycosyl transferase [Jannaschia sp. AI_62]
MGLCAQRNTVIAALPQDAIVLFLDDDFLLGDGSVSAVRKLFDDRPDVAVATGRVLADGIGGPGLTHDEGLSILNQAPPAAGVMTDTYNAYGCNMAIRVATASENDLWFDTDLPFYGWLEDVDMSRKLAAHGAVVKIDGLYGVHLGTKKGRSRGVPLGYSQIANPLYLVKRGTMSRRKAYRLMGRNILANVARTPRPEAWIDRFGRLRGNILAFVDLLRGRMSPTRIRDL